MIIPNDPGGNWRRKKLVEYIGAFPDEIGPLMKEFFKKNHYGKDYQVWWVLLYSACYCMGSACVMSENLDFRIVDQKGLETYWTKNKPKLIFQSDRRYIKNMNQFTEIAWEFIQRSGREPWNYIKRFIRDNPEDTYDALYKEVSSWKYYGRFGTVLFLYNLNKLVEVPLDSREYDWKNGSTTTAALFNANYRDDQADIFEKKSVLHPDESAWLDKQLRGLIKVLKKRYPEKNWTLMGVTSDLCSYRKLFKQTRYLGYYVDRQQEELATLQANYPEYYESLWKSFWQWRKRFIPQEYLGEVGGWFGVQKLLCKAWVQRGEFR